MKLLTIIYSDKIEHLSQFKSQATHWLPEAAAKLPTSKELSIIYSPPNIVCTIKEATLEMVSTSIKEGIINHSTTVYIEVDSTGAVAYTFDRQGNFNNFFSLKGATL